MSLNTDTMTYTVTARVLHWLTAIIVVTALLIGIAMDRIGEGPVADFFYNFHRSLGALLIPVALFRFYWRFTHKPPPLPADIPLPQRLVAEAVHYLLYAIIIVQPMIGWIATSAYRAPIPVFGLFNLPPIWPENRAFSEMLFTVHAYIGWALCGLLAMHIGGALFHHFIRKDRILMRMVTGA
jgi:cytochrome b561